MNAVAGWGGEERERDELGEGVREGLKRVGRSFEELAVGADQRVSPPMTSNPSRKLTSILLCSFLSIVSTTSTRHPGSSQVRA